MTLIAFLAGAGLLLYGIVLISIPAALIVAGLGLLILTANYERAVE